jgi:xanthosine utilization system XapX-like protein
MELNFGSSGGNFFMVISQIPPMIALETLGGITTGRSLAQLTAGRLAKNREPFPRAHFRFQCVARLTSSIEWVVIGLTIRAVQRRVLK